MDSNNKEPEVGLVQDMGIGVPPEPYRHLSQEAIDECRVIAHNYLNNTLGSETRALGRVMTNLLNEIEELKIELAEARAKAQVRADETKILVSRSALYQVLRAFHGHRHHVIELHLLMQGTGTHPIRVLTAEYNAQLDLPSSDETPTS